MWSTSFRLLVKGLDLSSFGHIYQPPGLQVFSLEHGNSLQGTFWFILEFCCTDMFQFHQPGLRALEIWEAVIVSKTSCFVFVETTALCTTITFTNTSTKPFKFLSSFQISPACQFSETREGQCFCLDEGLKCARAVNNSAWCPTYR